MWVIVLIIIAMFYIWKRRNDEAFSTKRSKAEEIIELFKHQPMYSEYRKKISGDIVEYEDMRALARKGELTVSAVMELV